MTAMEAAIKAAVKAALANGGAKTKRAKGRKGKEKLTDADKAAYMAANDAECVKVFEKAGFKDVQPRVNVLTYNKWIEKGRKVNKGVKSVRVNGFSLFHVDQTSEVGTVTADSPAANAQAA